MFNCVTVVVDKERKVKPSHKGKTMSSITRDYKSASDLAQEIVALYAPLTKGSMLPSYKRV